MLGGKTFLAIIPARGGSKRLPRKNILDLGGKPLIGWTIEAARRSNYIDQIVVTSDDSEILSIALQYGAKTLQRPDELSSDTASSFDAIKHAIDNMQSYDYIILLQPTSPLRTNTHIDEAIALLDEKKADAVISVCETDHSPLWSNTLPSDGSLTDFIRDEVKNKRSQDLEPFYRLNGAVYICKTETLLAQKSFFIDSNIFAYIMDKKSSIDIDEAIDFLFAETLIKASIA